MDLDQAKKLIDEKLNEVQESLDKGSFELITGKLKELIYEIKEAIYEINTVEVLGGVPFDRVCNGLNYLTDGFPPDHVEEIPLEELLKKYPGEKKKPSIEL